MRFVIFTHSLRSCWNHGNAHFLRGICRELLRRGHRVTVYEPSKSWSAENLAREHGGDMLDAYRATYPELDPVVYLEKLFDAEAAVAGADVVLVHEWNDHALVKQLGELRKRSSFRLLFHDTHHRSVTDRASMAQYELANYDGVLAFGDVIREIYMRAGWTRRAWTFHEAADVSVFGPVRADIERDLIWVGNWGDDERTRELHEFLIDPVRELKLSADVHGVRYPEHALQSLASASIEYRGWIANHEVPNAFARHRFTVHVPRGPYAASLPGIPTIRVFEALACGIPLISAPWSDSERLFRPGDYLVAHNGAEMKKLMRDVMQDESLRTALINNGLDTIRARHTCAHRVDLLLDICASLSAPPIAEVNV
jgi:spore maturation protein CgeB